MIHILFSRFLFVCMFFVTVLPVFPVNAQTVDAAAILEKAAQTYERSKGIAAQFTTIISSNQQQASEKVVGVINMKGDRFKLLTPDMHVFFDGTTQWTYLAETEEVNVTNPSGEDLLLINPSLLLKGYEQGFRAVYKGEDKGRDGKLVYLIELTPLKKSDMNRVVLQIGKVSSLPSGIVVSSKGGITTSIYITDLETGVNQPDSFFVFKEADYPDAEIIDLR